MTLPPFDGAASEQPQCELLAALVRCQRPGIAVEAGTYQGHAAHYIGEALRTNGIGHLHTADPYPCGAENTLRDLGEWVTYYQQDFLGVLEKLPHVDFAYIDASGPGPDGASLRWLHFQAVRDKLRSGGIICVDDTLSDDWADGENGHSAGRIRMSCNVSFWFLRGLSIYAKP